MILKRVNGVIAIILNLWHRKEELYNNHKTPGRQTKQSNQLSLPHQDDCKTRMDIKLRTAKHRTITGSHNGSNNKQQANNNNRTSAKNGQQPKPLVQGGGGLSAFYWYQIFALDSAVVEVQDMSSSHGSLTTAMYHGETLLSN